MSGAAVEALEGILGRIGKWGRFHLIYYSCLGFVVTFSIFTMNYIFVARDIKYRCFSEECDRKSRAEYNPAFLKLFVPFQDGFPERCLRFNVSSATTNVSDVCHVDFTDRASATVRCQKFVFERKEKTIVHDFQLFCEENLWMLTMVGTTNVAGELVSLSYSGFLSDRYGRKTVMAASLLSSSVCGLTKAFSVNYYMFIVFEFLDSALGGAMYGAAFVLAMEFVTAKDRNVGNTAISCVYAVGQVVFGFVAWVSPNWRMMLRILYCPGLLAAIAICVFLPESVRWLLAKNKVPQATNILHKIAKINNKELSPEEMENLEKLMFIEENLTDPKTSQNNFWNVLKTPVLFLRAIHCSMTWICCTFIFYGLTIYSVGLSENIYLSFILAAVAEIPGYVIYYHANEKVGRRKLMLSSLVLAGLFCLAVGFLPEGWCKLSAFFCGKCCITVAYTVLYVYVTELFPTSCRHTVFSMCSMFGRIGSMVAPQLPLLARISESLPLFLFSGMSLMFGFLALLLPETSHVSLPHTIEEAVNVGKRKTTEGTNKNCL